MSKRIRRSNNDSNHETTEYRACCRRLHQHYTQTLLARLQQALTDDNQNNDQVVPLLYAYWQLQQRYDTLFHIPPHRSTQLWVCGSEEFNTLALRDDSFDFDTLETFALPAPQLHERLLTAVRSTGAEARSVSCGGQHTCVLDTQGVVWTFGVQDDGSLGRDDEDGTALIGPVTGLPPMVQVAGGENLTLALDWQGQVWFWGMYRDCDQKKFRVATAAKDNGGFCARPVPIPNLKAQCVVAGPAGSLCAAILEDSSMVTWGFGNCGELARSEDMTEPNEQGEYVLNQTFYIQPVTKTDENGKEYEDTVINRARVQDKFLTPLPPRWAGAIPFPPREVLQIAVGAYHMLVVARSPDGSAGAYSAGNNADGQLGVGDYQQRHALTPIPTLTQQVAQVAAGQNHSLVLARHGCELYSFGVGDKGQLGCGPDSGKNRERFKLHTPQLVPFTPEPLVLQTIACGEHHSMALSTEGDLYTWGFGEMHQTGHNQDADVWRPRRLPGTFTAMHGGAQFSVFVQSGESL